MNIKLIKDVGVTGIKLARKFGPQLMAAGSTLCFFWALYFTYKEAPEAKANLKKLQEEKPEATVVEKVMVAGGSMKKAVLFATLATGLNVAAWKYEIARLVGTTVAATTAIKGQEEFIEAANEIVGKDKTNEIKQRVIDKHKAESDKIDPDIDVPDYYKKVPVRIHMTGKTFMSSKEEVESGMADNVDDLADTGVISLPTVYKNLKAGTCGLSVAWAIERSDGFGYSRAEAERMMAYDLYPYEDDYHRLGYELILRELPNMYEF